ncbi:MAG: nitroreductase family protein [Dehalococcoidales bacterium]|nr:nitroreductase family protein [Dehalococcoidales bacterium]
MNVQEAVTKRRTVRRFKDVPVPYEMLVKCVDAGRLAPAGRNFQLLDFLIVDDKKLLDEVFPTIASWAQVPRPSGPPPGHRPCAYIIVLIDAAREKEVGGTRRATQVDAGMASQNIILTAFEQGLGSCAILSAVDKELRQALNIPEKYEIGVLIALGYPDETQVVEPLTTTTKPYLDDRGVRHVPKRKLEDVLKRNKF